MFSEELMGRLARRIEGATRGPRVVATLKRWADGAGPRGYREEEPAERCEASWTAPRELRDAKEAGAPVHMYWREAV